MDETIASLRTYAAQSGLSFTAYIRTAYGPYMTESLLRECLTRDTLVQEYYNDHSDSLTYEESEIQAYYEEHGRAIVNLMREDRSLNAKTIVRNQYNDEWICRNQLLPLLEE